MLVELPLSTAADPTPVDQSPILRHDPSQGSQAAVVDPSPVSDGGSAERWRAEAAWAFWRYLNRATPHTAGLWVYYVWGFHVITYALGIYLLNLLIDFLSPMVDPEVEVLDARPGLPTRGSDEFKPFIHCLPEFKF